jgi:serine/threonine-protein kinase
MAALLEQLKLALADRYTVRHEIGRGGMATVFLAEDLRHHREVAIKVLHPQVAASAGTERFLQEIEIAASLDHPHILPVHDSGEAEGLLFYVMPRVHGESLRERLDREKQLSVEEAVRISREVADGLHHAHECGVVHRDIKPANIMLSDGHARVADFGIARAVQRASGLGLTADGIAVGSPAYMSPEQASGEEADRRSDVYALGCVSFEMLAGQPPFTGPTVQSVLMRKSVEPAPGLAPLRDTVPPAVEAAIAKAMSRVPADRFATAQDLREALGTSAAAPKRRVTIPILIMAALLAIVAVWQVGRGPQSGVVEVSSLGSIAVLPFANRGGGEETAPFVDGVHDDILTQLSKIGELKVISRTSVMKYRETDQNAADIGDELGVATLLEGGVQRSGDRVRVTVQLIDVRTDDHLWAETYDEELTAANVFAIQTDLARQIAGALQATLSPEVNARLASRPTESLEAYDLYAAGRYQWNQRSVEGMSRSIELFQQAIAIDSAYALAYAGLADAYTTLFSWGFTLWEDTAPQIDAALGQALALDPLLGEAHATRGTFLQNQRAWTEAEREFVRALELSPGYGTAHHWYALHLAKLGRFEQALSEIRRAAELDPLSSIISTNVGWLHYLARDYEASVVQLQRTIDRDPDFYYAHLLLGNTYAEQGRIEEALAASRRGTELARLPGVDLWLTRVYALAGRDEEALQMVDERPFGDPTRIALVFLALGEIDRTIELLEQAFETRSPFLNELSVDPRYDPIRSDPRFEAMVRRLGLE